MTRRQFAWGLVVIGTVVAIAVLSTAILVAASKATDIRDSQVTNTRTLDNSERTLRIIEDCTTPGQPCYERGVRRTANAVGDIQRVIVLAAACSVGLDPSRSVVERQSAIQACVIERLAAKP